MLNNTFVEIFRVTKLQFVAMGVCRSGDSCVKGLCGESSRLFVEKRRVAPPFYTPSKFFSMFLIVAFIALLSPPCAEAQVFEQTRAIVIGQSYTSDTDGFVTINARTGDCLEPESGRLLQKLTLTVNDIVVAEEVEFERERAVSITYPIAKGSRYTGNVSCRSAFSSAFFTPVSPSVSLLGPGENVAVNRNFLHARGGLIFVKAENGQCRSESSLLPLQSVDVQSKSFSEGRFLTETDVGLSKRMSVTVPVRAGEDTAVIVGCLEAPHAATFFPVVQGNAGFGAPSSLSLGVATVARTDGVLTISARPGRCISNGRLMQRVAAVIDGLTVADEQSYGAEQSLSVTVAIRKGSVVLPEAACPLAEAEAVFFPLSAELVRSSECSDGSDNDGDGLVDSLDPGCTTPLDDSEGDKTSQCQDTQDNDQDGAIDYPADYGCSSAQDNDESNIKAACQDGIDNDGDGFIDGNDSDCSSSQGNSEQRVLTECNDRLDNDGDGLIDIVDPGCSSSDDTTEDAAAGTLKLFTECVQDNRDGSYTAYFGYENSTVNLKRDQIVASFVGADSVIKQPNELRLGIYRGEARVNFSADAVEWVVAVNGETTRVAASRATKRCPPVEPRAECVDSIDATRVQGTLGYLNPNPFDIELPEGIENRLLGDGVIGKPTTVFKSGRHIAAFAISFSSRVLWILQGAPVELTGNASVCAGGCVGVSIAGTRSEVNSSAVKLAGVTLRASQFMERQQKKLKDGKIRAVLRSDIRRAKQRAVGFVAQAEKLMILFPTIAKACPNAASICSTISRAGELKKLKDLVNAQEKATNRFITRALFALKRTTARRHPLIVEAKLLADDARRALSELPDTVTSCG